LNNDYLDHIRELLSASPFVHEPQIEVDDRGEVWFIRADVYFIDNSRLHFRELFIGESQPIRKSYSYHYQRPDGALVFRYDNAPHYPDLPSAPHHKHMGESDVIAAEPPDLSNVLKEIENIIGSA
jgi:hypothetical protein